MAVWVVGAGSWGMRVAAKLDAMPGVVLGGMIDADAEKHHGKVLTPQGRWVSESLADVLYAATGGVESMGLVVAVPPCAQKQVVLQALRAGVKNIRVEKPCGVNGDEALEIAQAASAAGACVSVGFTLRALPVFGFVARLIGAAGRRVAYVNGVRLSSARPAHDVDAALDLGIHTASVAAMLGADRLGQLVVGFDTGTSHRTTTIVLDNNAEIIVEEYADKQRVTLDTGERVLFDQTDPLQTELQAFVDGNPLCMASDAVVAHDVLRGPLGRVLDVTPQKKAVAA